MDGENNGKPYWKGWFGGTIIVGNTHIKTFILFAILEVFQKYVCLYIYIYICVYKYILYICIHIHSKGYITTYFSSQTTKYHLQNQFGKGILGSQKGIWRGIEWMCFLPRERRIWNVESLVCSVYSAGWLSLKLKNEKKSVTKALNVDGFKLSPSTQKSPIISLKLTARPWKSMVGRWISFWVKRPIFRGANMPVSFKKK